MRYKIEVKYSTLDGKTGIEHEKENQKIAEHASKIADIFGDIQVELAMISFDLVKEESRDGGFN